MKGAKRKRRLRYLNRLRRWRDEVLNCENMGRIRKLIMNRTEVHRISTQESMMSDVTIELFDGYEFYARNFWMRVAVAEAIMKVYFHLIKQ